MWVIRFGLEVGLGWFGLGWIRFGSQKWVGMERIIYCSLESGIESLGSCTGYLIEDKRQRYVAKDARKGQLV